MAQYRNITEDTLWVVTDAGMVKVDPESVLTVDDTWAGDMYFQTGDTGETPLFEVVASTKKKASDPAPSDPPADAPSNN